MTLMSGWVSFILTFSVVTQKRTPFVTIYFVTSFSKEEYWMFSIARKKNFQIRTSSVHLWVRVEWKILKLYLLTETWCFTFLLI